MSVFPSSLRIGLPDDLRRALIRVLSSHLAKQLAAGGWTEEEILADFAAFRRRLAAARL